MELELNAESIRGECSAEAWREVYRGEAQEILSVGYALRPASPTAFGIVRRTTRASGAKKP
jgi:hypothetical protein